ncbi:hypothetical protein AZE42_09823 [Rhizopogon vesiculosus]|uniref:GATA-type domain-containing protein n=1 Tax=Rhizopogon vesiculosus TaxID=180088 RepID=A0A1J8QKL4_9AGAM|nr:hypothetical protein AZE42_09823 [Rhizopogon vesiculosus]
MNSPDDERHSRSPVQSTLLFDRTLEITSFLIFLRCRRPHNCREYDYDHDHSYRRSTPSPIATSSYSPSLSVSSLPSSSAYVPAPHRPPADRSVDSHSGYSDDYGPYHSALQSIPKSLTGGHGRMSNNYSHAPYAVDIYHDDSHLYHMLPSYTSPPVTHSTQSSGRDNPQLSYPIPGQNYHTIAYTDDAATKLSDRVRRRCYNCCTTDSSTWRRSASSPGKVVCNKCGLLQRTMKA